MVMSFHVWMCFNVRLFDAYAAASLALMCISFLFTNSSATGHGFIRHSGGAFWRTHFVRSARGTASAARTAGERERREKGEAQCGQRGFSCRFHGVDFCVAVSLESRGSRLLFRGFLLFVAAGRAFIVGALVAAVAALFTAGAAVFGGLHFRMVLVLRERGSGGESQGEEGELQGFHGLVFSLVAWWISGGVVPLV